MSNYTKATNFAIKDSLVTTDPAKIIKGTDIDNEYNAISNAIASKADTNSPALTGTPTAPTAPAGTNTTQIATTAFALANGVPSGAILLWSGSVASIPSGWVLCNGSSGTPDLRNRFVVGAGSTYAVGATGGSADAVVVAHSHTASSSSSSYASDSGHSHSTPAYITTVNAGGNSPAAIGGSGYQPSGGSSTGTGYASISVSTSTSTTVNSAGVSGTNANLPPYYALAYIMKS